MTLKTLLTHTHGDGGKCSIVARRRREVEVNISVDDGRKFCATRVRPLVLFRFWGEGGGARENMPHHHHHSNIHPGRLI